jgi:serine/threonine protein kinase
MGEVYLAQDEKLDRKIALKFLPPELQQDETARRRFLREARSAAALDHPFVCHIHEIGETEGAAFIAMEYVPGERLDQRLAKGPLPLKEALETAVEIAEALEAAHKHHIVHRDLKPSNILLTPEGHVKVMDFGLAKRLPSEEAEIRRRTESPFRNIGGARSIWPDCLSLVPSFSPIPSMIASCNPRHWLNSRLADLSVFFGYTL